MRVRSWWNGVLSSAGALAVVAGTELTPVAEPRWRPLDREQPWAAACQAAVANAIRGDDPRARKIEWFRTDVRESSLSDTQTAVSGQGHYVSAKGKSERYTFSCVYDLEKQRVTSATQLPLGRRDGRVGTSGRQEQSRRRACEHYLRERLKRLLGVQATTINMQEEQVRARGADEVDIRGRGWGWVLKGGRIDFTYRCIYDQALDSAKTVTVEVK